MQKEPLIDPRILNSIRDYLPNVESFTCKGRITKVIGIIAEAEAPPVPIGELMWTIPPTGRKKLLEVVGFQNDKLLLMPYDDLDGVWAGMEIAPSGLSLKIPNPQKLIGRVVDGLGRPIDEGPEIPFEDDVDINGEALNPLTRPRIANILTTGIKSIDAFNTVGQGQKIGIFSGSGVGKSVLLGMIARHTSADVNVIALIGERGKEVREFIEKDLGEEGLKNSVVVVATSDQSALKRMKGAYVAMQIAQKLRDSGKNVLFLMDSLTRFAQAGREIGLAAGEPPATRGYPPSVFHRIPKLLEKVGPSPDGSITGIFTVLVEGDDLNEPISDAARSVLDGHVVLSRDLAHQNHYPALDVLQSISRVMKDIRDPEMNKAANTLREVMAEYNDVKDLIAVGAYKEGSNPNVDLAIKMMPEINKFLRQGIDEKWDVDATSNALMELIGSMA
ncbi:FliI/YscN family ATPase [bacterium]|nr:FliI/YscN family ATPase [bacterium]